MSVNTRFVVKACVGFIVTKRPGLVVTVVQPIFQLGTNIYPENWKRKNRYVMGRAVDLVIKEQWNIRSAAEELKKCHITWTWTNELTEKIRAKCAKQLNAWGKANRAPKPLNQCRANTLQHNDEEDLCILSGVCVKTYYNSRALQNWTQCKLYHGGAHEDCITCTEGAFVCQNCNCDDSYTYNCVC